MMLVVCWVDVLFPNRYYHLHRILTKDREHPCRRSAKHNLLLYSYRLGMNNLRSAIQAQHMYPLTS